MLWCRGGRAGRNIFLKAGGTPATTPGFTILELLIVITIIIVLAGLILATSGYVQKKGARSRTEAEIAAISAALENYKADNGIYPRGNGDLSNRIPSDTDNLNARNSGIPSAYQAACLYLYKQLSGDLNANLQPAAGNKVYFSFKPQMLSGTKDSNGNLTTVDYIRDPFGYSYGYSTAFQNDPNTGYNPTFDLWSTSALTTNPPATPPDTITPQWIKNW